MPRSKKSNNKQLVLAVKNTPPSSKQKQKKKFNPPRAASQAPLRNVPLISPSSIPKPYLSITHTSSPGVIRVKGVDVFARLITAQNFTPLVTQLPINPLNGLMFPKLSAMAALYEKWRMAGPFRVRYHSIAPVTQVGYYSSYIETDPSDPVTVSNMIGVLNEQYSATAPVYAPWVLEIPPSVQIDKWLLTSTSSEDPRLQSAGYLQVYGEGAATAGVMTGFLSCEYDFLLTVFRPPTTTGFQLGYTPSVAQPITSTRTIPFLSSSDGTNDDFGPMAGRYLLDGAKMFLGTGSLSAFSDFSSLWLPLLKTTAGMFGISFSSPPASDFRHVEQKTPPARPVVVRTSTPSFAPWRCRELPDGTWVYQMSDGDEWTPYPDPEEKSVLGPLVLGDVTGRLSAINPVTNVTTDLVSVVFPGSGGGPPTSGTLFVPFNVTPSTAAQFTLQLTIEGTGTAYYNSVMSVVGPTSDHPVGP